MRKIKSMILAGCAIFAISSVFAGCGQKNDNNSSDTGSQKETPKAEETPNADISGSITAVGSSALQQLVEKAAQNFMLKNKNAKVQVQGGGSGTGLTQVFQGGADIGNSDIFADEKLTAEQAKELVDHQVCVVGFATVVNKNVKVDNLTKQQLIDIFTGKITNWKEVGGDDMKIVIINRPKSSGTRATFKKYALDGKEEAEGKALTEDSSGTVKKTIADTEGAISYLALSYVDESIKMLKYEGVEAKVENITSGKYPIWSYEHMYTKGEPKGLTKAFLDYMMSEEVQGKLVSEMGYIPTKDMKTTRSK